VGELFSGVPSLVPAIRIRRSRRMADLPLLSRTRALTYPDVTQRKAA
jgi:hypothetical protein